MVNQPFRREHFGDTPPSVAVKGLGPDSNFDADGDEQPALALQQCLPRTINSSNTPPSFALVSTVARSSSDGLFDTVKDEDVLLPLKEPRPVKFVLWVLFWASLSLAVFAVSGDAEAVVDSIRASSFGFKVANRLHGLGWADEAVVFALATLPVIELRGAIPVGYWLQLKPTTLTILSILGLVFIYFCQSSLPPFKTH